jgi:hypothetical protein
MSNLKHTKSGNPAYHIHSGQHIQQDIHRHHAHAQSLQVQHDRLQKTDHKPGDLVLVRNMKHKGTVSLDLKVQDRYLGPYEIHRKNQGDAYELKELDGTHFQQAPVATFRLLPYITRSHWFMRTGWMGPEDPTDEHSDSSSTGYSEGE